MSVLGSNNHIEGFRNANTKFLDAYGLNVVAVRLNNCHFQSGNTDIKVRHRRGVDKAQPDPLTWLENSSPVLLWALTVYEACKALQVFDIRFHHAHIAPRQAIFKSTHKPIFRRVGKKLPNRLLLAVVVIRHHFEIAHDPVASVRMLVG